MVSQTRKLVLCISPSNLVRTAVSIEHNVNSARDWWLGALLEPV